MLVATVTLIRDPVRSFSLATVINCFALWSHHVAKYCSLCPAVGIDRSEWWWLRRPYRSDIDNGVETFELGNTNFVLRRSAMCIAALTLLTAFANGMSTPLNDGDKSSMAIRAVVTQCCGVTYSGVLLGDL